MQPLLFIIKQNTLDYTDCEGKEPLYRSSGLLNSATFIVNELQERGVKAKLVMAIDNNCIDRLLTENKPRYCIIEALWVVPEKFIELTKLHPNVEFIVRLHSETPFLAQEGIAFEWIKKYVTIPNVSIGSNSLRNRGELEALLQRKVLYLPNFYPVKKGSIHVKHLPEEKSLDIGCFGAIRPFKNQVMQAIAAISYANSIGKKLRFHINGSRIEVGGAPILKSLRALFADTEHELVENLWMTHDRFLEVIAKMDVLMQVSFTETFNIVAADAISQNVPIVTSREILWSHSAWQANPTSFKEIRKSLELAYKYRRINVCLNRRGLSKNGRAAIAAWFRELI